MVSAGRRVGQFFIGDMGQLYPGVNKIFSSMAAVLYQSILKQDFNNIM